MTEVNPDLTQTSLSQRVLGITDPGDIPGSLAAAYATLTGEPITTEALLAETDALAEAMAAASKDVDLYALPTDVVERRIANGFLLSLCIDNKPYEFANVLNRWPNTADQYERFVKPQAPAVRPNVARRALLIGSLSAVSSAAFVALATDVYGATPNQAHIIDPRIGTDKKRHGTTVQANGLAMPYRDGSMHVVQTNALLHMMLGANKQTVDHANYSTATTELLHEAHRVMAPGGHLLMYESVPGFDRNDLDFKNAPNQRLKETFISSLQTCLEEAAFSVRAIETAWNLSGDFLFDPSRQFSNYQRIPFPRAVMVCARKAEE